jgi:hypothetical protein
VLDEPELGPVLCLRHLNAIVSQHPYDLEPVRPVVTFDLSKSKFVEEIDVVAGLDSRPDLVALDPSEFEHLVRRHSADLPEPVHRAHAPAAKAQSMPRCYPPVGER